MGFLENLFNRYTPRTPGKPVFAVIDTETTGFNKRYDRIIELAAVRADAYFNPVDSWHTLLNPDGKAIKNSHIHGELAPESWTGFNSRRLGLQGSDFDIA
ncbi:3'-5' exonuclease, partial [Corynebacterium sp. 32222D000AT]